VTRRSVCATLLRVLDSPALRSAKTSSSRRHDVTTALHSRDVRRKVSRLIDPRARDLKAGSRPEETFYSTRGNLTRFINFLRPLQPRETGLGK